MTKAERITDLICIITTLDTLYQQGEDCIHPDTGELVSDGEYDLLRNELKKLDPKNSLFHKPTASTVGVSNIVQHDPVMVSIEKANHEQFDNKVGILFKWLRDRVGQAPKSIWDQDKDFIAVAEHKGEKVEYPEHFFVQMYKLDGLAIALYYKDGKLVKAGLRSREGTHGEDVTENAKYVQGIPTVLPVPITCSIRGEIICKKSDFDAAQAARVASGDKPFANERACAVGGMRQLKDPTKTRDHRLSFLGYGIENLDKPPYETERARAVWSNKKLGVPFVCTEFFKFSDLEKMEAEVPNLDYRVDGVVVSANFLDFQEQLGRHGDKATGNPRGKIAWKFAEETAAPVVKEIEFNTGRSGKVTPVVIFDAVTLGDTQVQRCSVHNWGFMVRKQISIGTRIKVLKSGNIIPKVIGVVDNPKSPKQPDHCPSCLGALDVDHTPAKGAQEEMWELVCRNPDCPAQLLNNLCYFLETIGAKGLGDVKVGMLIASGQVKQRSDFFKLNLLTCEASGLSHRQSLLALATIHLVPGADQIEDDGELYVRLLPVFSVKHKIPFWKLFKSLGISTAGEAAGKALIDHFKTFNALRKASDTDMAVVDGIGLPTAQIVSGFLKTHSDEIDRLLEHLELELPKQGKLSGKIFVLSGSLDGGKDYWKTAIENQGGKCSGSVGKRTSYLVAGDGSGDKTDKAKELGVAIITVDDLKKMMNC